MITASGNGYKIARESSLYYTKKMIQPLLLMKFTTQIISDFNEITIEFYNPRFDLFYYSENTS